MRPAPPRLELSAPALHVGDSTRVRALDAATSVDRLTLRSTDPAVAEVHAGGWVIARGVGRTQIVASEPGASGATTLDVTVSAAAVECSYVGAIGVNQSVNGSLASSDCRLEDGSYADPYSLTISGSAAVQIDLSSSAFDAFLMLSDASGNVIASDDDSGGSLNSRIRRTLSAGTYTVWVNSVDAGETGSYRLAISRTDGGGSGGSGGSGSSGGSTQCNYTGSIGANQSASGALASGDCRLSDGSYADAYAFSLGAASTVQIDLSSSAFDAYLVLTDANGAVVASDDDSGGGHNAQIRRTLAAGTYTIWASSVGAGRTGSYRLTVIASNGSGGSGGSGGSSSGCTSSGSIGLGQSVSGTLGASDCRLSDGAYADAYALNVGSQAGVQVDLTSTAFDGYLIIVDASGNVVASDDDGGGSLNAQIRRTLPAGHYWVWVTSVGTSTTGAYRLSIARTDGGGSGGQTPTGGSCNYVGTMGLNQSASGTLGAGDCRLSSGAYADAYVLIVNATTTVQIDLTSGAFDAWVALFDANSNLIANDDDSGGGFNAQIRRTLTAGTYYVWVTSVGTATTGSYRLTVGASGGSSGGTSPIPGGNRACTASGSLSVNQAQSGALASGDCLMNDGSYADAYLLTLTAAEALQVDATSATFDAILVVTDEQGHTLWVDDDGGTGTNARIRTKLPAGRYWIWVSSFGLRATGSYSLTVVRR